MAIDVRVYRYRLPLRSPLHLPTGELSSRAGILITKDPTAGTWGDAAPLPGFSHESLDDVLAALRGESDRALPSLQFARRCLQPVDHLPVSRLGINALLMGDVDTMVRRAGELGQSGFRSIKLKVGWQSNLQDEVELVRLVRKRLRNDQLIRLDANRAWSLEQAVNFARQVAELGIEYIEEPTASPRDLEACYGQGGVPYALDETLREVQDESDLRSFPNAAAYIIKPTLLGERFDLSQWSRQQVPLVFSSCFESGIGVFNIARLAAAYAPRVATGLDTYRWLADDLLKAPLPMQDGFLQVGESPPVDLAKLEEIQL